AGHFGKYFKPNSKHKLSWPQGLILVPQIALEFKSLETGVQIQDAERKPMMPNKHHK
ncbi:hypothetical protein ACMD2_23824, partial [Ananas comosus]